MPKSAAKPTKQMLRAQCLERLEALGSARRKRLSAAIVARCLRQPAFAQARTVMFFWPMVRRGEVDILPLLTAALKEGKTVCLPRVDWARRRLVPARIESIRDLEPDPGRPRLGLNQPRASCRAIAPARLDLILVPGLVYDRNGGRLGRGGGFYDRFLAKLPSHRRGGPLRVSVAFAQQVVRSVPMDAHDEPIDLVITPTAAIRRGAAGNPSPRKRVR